MTYARTLLYITIIAVTIYIWVSSTESRDWLCCSYFWLSTWLPVFLTLSQNGNNRSFLPSSRCFISTVNDFSLKDKNTPKSNFSQRQNWATNPLPTVHILYTFYDSKVEGFYYYGDFYYNYYHHYYYHAYSNGTSFKWRPFKTSKVLTKSIWLYSWLIFFFFYSAYYDTHRIYQLIMNKKKIKLNNEKGAWVKKWQKSGWKVTLVKEYWRTREKKGHKCRERQG